jgi:hypothetical protein
MKMGAEKLLVCWLMVFGVALAFSSAAAGASKVTHLQEPFSPLTGSGSGLVIHTPFGIAVDESSGNVFVNDGTGGEVVAILGAEGGAPAGLVPPFTIAGVSFTSGKSGAAFDNSPTSPNQGTLYVADAKGSKKVKKYARNPTTEKFELAGELTGTPPFTEPAGVALDPHGNVYVADSKNSGSVVKFDASGAQVQQIPMTALPSARPSGIAVDAAGNLFATSFAGNRPLFKWPANASGEIPPGTSPIQVPGVEAVTGVAVDTATDALYVIFTTSVEQYDADTLAYQGSFGSGVLVGAQRLAVNSSSGRIYVSDNGTGKKNVAVFGPAVPLPEVVANAPTDITATKASLSGTVNVQGYALEECKFEYGPTSAYGQMVPCVGAVPTDSSPHPVTADISGLTPNSATYHFRLVARTANGTESSSDRSFETAKTVATGAATTVTDTTATLNGALSPEGVAFTDCRFEYLTDAAYKANFFSYSGANTPLTRACTPAAGEIEADFQPHPVSGAVTGLVKGTIYHFRLVGTSTTGVVPGEDRTFTTSGTPVISEELPIWVDQSTATLRAKINPEGFGTSYRFEWGPGTSYGNSVPADFEPFIGSGTDPVTVTANLSGLTLGTRYHFRVVAHNSSGTTFGQDHEFWTLNSCGLPNNRCFELVSPADKGPVAGAGDTVHVGTELRFQAAGSGGDIAYSIAYGLPDSTSGGEVLHRALRQPTRSKWETAQISPPTLVPSQSETSIAALTLGLAKDLNCGVIASVQPLTADTPREPIDLGQGNLFRRNPDGSYTIITSEVPTNGPVAVPLSEYLLAGASRDCKKVVFSSKFTYPGVAGAGAVRLYEWDQGVLRNVGVVPGPTGPQVVAASAGLPNSAPGTSNSFNLHRAVSVTGDRVFFTAVRQVSALGGEVGKEAVFVRENGSTTVDVSKSQTAIPSGNARYQTASSDGDEVFFTANHGLTSVPAAGWPSSCAPASGAGCDLYRYSLDTGTLVNLSMDSNPADTGGAGVAGVLDSSEDGSHVYFAARGQLVPGKGNTQVENLAANEYSVYLSHGGALKFVGTLEQEDLVGELGAGALVIQNSMWTSRATPDGRHLLFGSRANLTGYDSGAIEAYLYDAGADTTVCVSCRRDGQPSLDSGYDSPFARGKQIANESNPPRMLTDDGSRVFFVKRDRLAGGAEEGQKNLYQWEEGQVSFLASSAPGFLKDLQLAGASANGDDVYFTTMDRLNWEDVDGRMDVYDARAGGGFAEPQPPPADCNPLAESSCQDSGAAHRGAPPVPASSVIVGSGNQHQSMPKKGKKKKKTARNKSKKQGKRHSKKHKRAHVRSPHTDRRAGQ